MDAFLSNPRIRTPKEMKRMTEKEKDSLILVKYIFKTLELVGKGYKGEALVNKLDKLTERSLRKIKSETIKIGLKENYDKCIKQYTKDFGYDNLKLIKE